MDPPRGPQDQCRRGRPNPIYDVAFNQRVARLLICRLAGLAVQSLTVSPQETAVPLRGGRHCRSLHGHSVTWKTMKPMHRHRPPAGFSDQHTRKPASSECSGNATDEGMLRPGADARSATRHPT